MEKRKNLHCALYDDAARNIIKHVHFGWKLSLPRHRRVVYLEMNYPRRDQREVKKENCKTSFFQPKKFSSRVNKLKERKKWFWEE
jgi:hypothetical protein